MHEADIGIVRSQMTTNVFIDTNVLLSFYHLTSDDLEELNKLAVLLERNEITLWLTEQVKSEFWRNRENKIADALKGLKQQRLNLQFPQLSRGYDEYTELRELQRRYGEKHARLLQKIGEDAENHTLKADETIRRLFQNAYDIPLSSQIVDKARDRVQIGNPPGKRNSLGDAINWETLLEEVPPGEGLHFITDDQDYFSSLDESKFNEFLLREWSATTTASFSFYRRLSTFFEDNFPDIKLAAELEKEFLIQKLAASASFAETHTTISKLNSYTEFTADQVNEFADAAIMNDQILLILRDSDVSDFLKSVVAMHRPRMHQQNLLLLTELLGDVGEEVASPSDA